MPSLEARFRAALLGAACGDALGATLEFMTRDAIKRRYGALRDIVGGGWLDLAPGQVTDDTEMMLAVAEGILACPEDPVAAIGARFIEWYRTGPKDVGGTCSLAIRSAIELGNGGEPDWQAAAAAVRGRLGDQAAGNGALMRTLPVALAYYGDDRLVDRMAGKIAWMTHPTHVAAWSCSLYCLLVCRILDGMSKEEALRWAFEWTRYQDAPAIFTPQGLLEEPAAEVSGYTVTTLHAALWAFATGSDAEDVIVRAANLGGDTDTVAAVAGGLAGAYHGQLPERWLQTLDPAIVQALEAASGRLVARHATGTPDR